MSGHRIDLATLSSTWALSPTDRRAYLGAVTRTDRWSVSWWVEAERYWQFAGEGTRAWADQRAAELERTGHKVRVRRA